jgi:post-segregation antitoxin (ccd killing protein)
MPRLQVDLPDDLYRAVKELGLPVSELLQEALRLEMRRRRQILAATEEYLAELVAEVGEPTPEEAAAAEALVRRIVEHAKAAAV